MAWLKRFASVAGAAGLLLGGVWAVQRPRQRPEVQPGGGGGASGNDFGLVKIKPGTVQMVAAGSAAIDKVAKALTDRPTLAMTVTAAADPASEREAFQNAALEARSVAEQRREALRHRIEQEIWFPVAKFCDRLSQGARRSRTHASPSSR